MLQKKSLERRGKPYVIEFLKYQKYMSRRVAAKLLLKKRDKADIILIGFTSQWGEESNPQTGEKKKVDAMLHPLIEELQKKNISFMNSDIDFTPTLGLSTMLERKEYAFPAEFYMDPSVRRIARKEKKKIKDIYTRSKKAILASLMYRNINLGTLLEKRFDFFIEHRAPEAIAWIETFCNMMRSIRPKSVLIIDETSITGRAAIVAGRLCHAKTIGLQHGIIAEHSFEYYHLPGEVSENADIHAPVCPIPDVTAVHGENTKHVLTKTGRYPEKSIVVTGQPRYDCIKTLQAYGNHEKIASEFGIDPSKKIILIATQPSKDKFIFLRDVLAELKHMDYEIVIKPHPRETDYEKYYEIAKKAGVRIKIINKDLFRLLYLGDAIIHRASIVGIEAMLFEKPVICFPAIYSEAPAGEVFFHDEMTIKNGKDLQLRLKEMMVGENRLRCIKRQNDFLKEVLANYDGKATKRVIDLLHC